ncbi:MAG: 6-phosphofructokinase [Acutalibacteraceae bacterium]
MNIAVAQSGGPTCAINASLVGVFREALRSEKIEIIYGSRNGIEGMIGDGLVNLSDKLTGEDDIALLLQTPSTALGSCRYKLPPAEKDAEPYEAVLATMQRYGIGAFFYIGGNDSMDTVAKLSAWLAQKGSPIRVIGVPKTIDNDLMYTDHTPGFGSAAKYVAATVQEIIRDSSVYSLQSVTVIEIMGRHAGWLTASCSVLRANGETAPHLIYLPENPFSVQKFLDDIRQQQKKYKAVVVAVSEGISFSADEAGSGFLSGVTDPFGHKYLSGVGKCLEHIVRRELHCKVRSVELNVMQRCSSHLASLTDLDEAQQIGAGAVRAALAGETGKMMIFRRVADHPYAVQIDSVNAGSVANKEKPFPAEWINEQQNNVLPAAIDYFLPLIQGEPAIRTQNGLPIHYII